MVDSDFDSDSDEEEEEEEDNSALRKYVNGFNTHMAANNVGCPLSLEFIHAVYIALKVLH